MLKDSLWRDKYKSTKEYYLDNYDNKYYYFDKEQFKIDPDETVEDLEMYDQRQQELEFIKCGLSFSYFCHKFVKVLHSSKGLQPFILYNYQNKVIHDYDNHQHNIIRKFRQGGITTLTLIKGLHMCLFDQDKQVLFLSKTDREATDSGMIVDRVVEYLPAWMKPDKAQGKWNDHIKTFASGGAIKFYSVEAARGKSVTFLIIDEAAFIPGLEDAWAAIYPTISGGGRSVLISTVNGYGNFYADTWFGAKEKRNKFYPIDLHYTEHPEYKNPEWVEEQKVQLGDKKFKQEILADFLGTGSTYFPSNIVAELTEETMKLDPKKKLYSKWINTKPSSMANMEEGGFEQGAFWIWKEPIAGHEYLLTADCAEGQKENNDNSCFHIIDINTFEQVAEFYSNVILPHEFALVIQQVGTLYNNALVVIEDMNPGNSVLSNLQHQLFYENLYYEDGKLKPGVKTTPITRNLFLECMQNNLVNKIIKINSKRLAKELDTFRFNPTSKKAMAEKGKHDDGISALAMGLFVLEQSNRGMPIGETKTKIAISSAIKQQTYQEIKKELMESLNVGEKDFEYDTSLIKDEDYPALGFRRKYDNLLKEFGM